MEKDVYLALINTIMERIEYLENNDPDNANLDELRLLLSDNVSKDGKIHIRSSLLNKNAYNYFSNYTNYLNKFEKEHLCN
jgi:Zn-dependent metalloprotease